MQGETVGAGDTAVIVGTAHSVNLNGNRLSLQNYLRCAVQNASYAFVFPDGHVELANDVVVEDGTSRKVATRCLVRILPHDLDDADIDCFECSVH